MWSTVNRAMTALVDAWLWPVQGLGMAWQVAALALPATALALLIYRLVSNQAGIQAQKDKIKAYLLELLLYKDDLRVTLAAQGLIFRHTLRYMGHALLPMLVMLVPFLLIMVQVESRFAFRGLDTGSDVILNVSVDPAQQRVLQTDYRLELPDGLTQQTPPVRVADGSEVLWRLRATADGDLVATIHAGTQTVSKHIPVGATYTRVAPSIYRDSNLLTLGYPAEAALAGTQPVTRIQVDFPRARAEFAGLSSASWLLFLFSIVFGLALRGVLGVTF